MAVPRKAGLGRGLSALLDDARATSTVGAQSLPIAEIVPNEDQPRRSFDATKLAELAQSIAARGVLQPILVRPLGDGRYEIVAGERRWRAAQQAQLHEIPALVREMEPGAALEVAIVENVQRADLSPIEEAASYRRLQDEFGHTQDEVGRLVGKSRSHVANLMRLLDLPLEVREHVDEGRLTMGHARAILTAPDPARLAAEVIARGLSVRETEARATKGSAVAPVKPTYSRNADLAMLEKQLTQALGLKVDITNGPTGGDVVVGYATLDQLDHIVKRLGGGHV